MLDLCPACGMREADDYDTGWCSRCAGVAVTESYQERKVNARREGLAKMRSKQKEETA
jgi:hypothetical protein